MSERDCGKWYCQGAAGFREMKLGVDVKLAPVRVADDDDRKDLTRERGEIKAWMAKERQEGWAGWLAAYSHGNGAASHYWVWDPDSRGRYMEARLFNVGQIDKTYGELHRGRGWQLPLLAVFPKRPVESDLKELREVKVPYVVLEEIVDPPDDEDPDLVEAIKTKLFELQALIGQL